MKGQESWYEQGVAAGRTMRPLETDIDGIVAAIRSEVEKEIEKVTQEIARIRGSAQEAGEELKEVVERRQALRGRFGHVEDQRESSLSRFSTVKGVLYILGAWACLVADVALLGDAIIFLFGFDATGETGKEAAICLAQLDFDCLYRDFPHVSMIALSILLTGIFFKVFKDVYEDKERSPLDIKMFGLFGIMAALVLVGTALARTAVTFEESTAYSAQSLLAALLGLALPLLSAGFFIRGYEVLAQRYWLFRNSMGATRQNAWYWFTRRGQLRKLANLKKLEARHERLGSEEYLRHEAEIALDRYRRGYFEGCARAWKDGPGLEQAKGAAVSKILGHVSKVALGAFLLLFSSGCENLINSEAEGELGENDPRSTTTVILFDPTSGDGSAKDQVKALLDTALQLLAEEAEVHDELKILLVGDKAFSPDKRFFEFKILPSERGRDAKHDYEERWRQEIEERSDDAMAAWETAHEDASGLHSCILAGLYAISKIPRQEEASRRFQLIVVSDFLEACKIWDEEAVNLETGREAVDAFAANDFELELGRFERVRLFWVPARDSLSWLTVVNLRRLEEVWKNIFVQSGVPEGQIEIRE